MRKLFGTGAGLVLSIIITAVMGFWNPRGVLPIGDARIPAWPVGILGVVGGALTGLAGGSETARRAFGRLLPANSPNEDSMSPQQSAVRDVSFRSTSARKRKSAACRNPFGT